MGPWAWVNGFFAHIRVRCFLRAPLIGVLIIIDAAKQIRT
jgi:hypothetical protein